ncbi:hypothetical protein MARI_32860 [Marinobacter sp. JH2]|nr:hypothetical protein [Marinobacter sp. JH2]QBM19143.1 hypothetical protein MARI_32860 [Marinobacter sp. JH2]
MHKRNNRSSEKELIKTPEFLCAIAVPLTLAGIVTTTISANGDLNICFHYECFNNLLTYFKVPLGIASLSIPLGALAAAQHRSQQTLHQINLQRAQNNLTGYFTHKENFSELCSKLFTGKIICDADVLHENLFPYANQGNYNLADRKELTVINQELLFIEQKLLNYIKGDEPEHPDSEVKSLKINLKSLGVELDSTELRIIIKATIKVTKAAEYMSQIDSSAESQLALPVVQEIQNKSNRILEVLTALREKQLEERRQTSP